MAFCTLGISTGPLRDYLVLLPAFLVANDVANHFPLTILDAET
jgi:hypothetical protein